MFDIDRLTAGKAGKYSVPATGEVKNPQPQSAEFRSLLLEVRMKQMAALGELLGQGGEKSPDSLSGLQSPLDLLSLYEKTRSPAGAENDFYKRQGISQYRAVEPVQDKAPVPPVSANKAVTPIRQLISETAGKYGIPEPWFEKLIRQESGLDPAAESPKGAMGLGQLMPATARELGLRASSPRDREEGSVWHPASNLDASARYLRQLYDLYANKGIDANEVWSFAAGAYNAGMGNIQKALDRLESGRPPAWEDVAAVLPQVTGTASRETLRYVDNLRA